MKKTAERETSKSTLGYSGRELRAPSPGDKRYIYRPDDGKFIQRPDRCSPKYVSGYRIVTSLSQADKVSGEMVAVNLSSTCRPLRPDSPVIEVPDFTDADKEWIDKIDRTQLSWDEW